MVEATLRTVQDSGLHEYSLGYGYLSLRISDLINPTPGTLTQALLVSSAKPVNST